MLRELKSVAHRGIVAGPLVTLQEFIAHAPTYWNYENQAEVIFDPTDGTCRTEIAWPLTRTEA